jgi:uncharacterized protein (TIGR00288 family)
MEEERIALFLDFENLAIGAREQLRGVFDFKPIADALAERGRVVVRRAYADWSMFGDAMRDMTRHHIELIEIPQKMGAVRKNAADIKLAVDAIELCYEREYITTFVIGTGDSDFTPLVHKLRELNKRVIGIGVEAATSGLLPPACDEFLFYERLPGVNAPTQTPRKRGARTRAAAPAEEAPPARAADMDALDVLVTQTLAGLKRRSADPVLGSMLKRTLLRKDPTFDEGQWGFRSLGDMLRNQAERNVVQLNTGSAPGDPEVDFPQATSSGKDAFELLRSVVSDLGSPHLSGLKDEVRKRKRGFTEKRLGYGGFLQFARAAHANGYIDMEWDEEAGDYRLRAEPAAPDGATTAPPEAPPESASDTPPASTDGDRVLSRTRVRRKAKPKA